MCGKNIYQRHNGDASKGSPPHVREKRKDCSTWNILCRITPACAGKTQLQAEIRCLRQDHPRECGKNFFDRKSLLSVSGSPPRVREKHFCWVLNSLGHGITPASAGKTFLLSSQLTWTWDHPRECGKNFNQCFLQSLQLGSPPRVREKLLFVSN